MDQFYQVFVNSKNFVIYILVHREEKTTSRKTAKYSPWMTTSACYNHRESKLGSSQSSISAIFWAIKSSTEESKLNACQTCCPFVRLTSQHSTDNYLEIFKLTGCDIYNLNWRISVFTCFHFWPPSTYQERITLREQQSFDFLIWKLGVGWLFGGWLSVVVLVCWFSV